MSRLVLITDSGSLVSLPSQNPDDDAVNAAAKRLMDMGVAGFVASITGPASSAPEMTLVRAFGDPAQTFAEARQRLANRRRRSASNKVFR